jgi:hypothetical protein
MMTYALAVERFRGSYGPPALTVRMIMQLVSAHFKFQPRNRIQDFPETDLKP